MTTSLFFNKKRNYVFLFPMTLRFLSSALAALLLPGTLHAAPVFLENVSESGGWYDCNKKTKWTWGTKPHPTNPLNPPVSARAHRMAVPSL